MQVPVYDIRTDIGQISYDCSRGAMVYGSLVGSREKGKNKFYRNDWY